MSDAVVIDRRFRGPPDSGNGGYTCGMIAAHIDGPAEVTLRRPPPLDTPLQVIITDDGAVRVLVDEVLIAEGAPRSGELGVDVPAPVTVADAEAASAVSPLRLDPSEHPFPGCFVCGPHRTDGDGMGIIVAPVPGRDVAAANWTPGADLADVAGVVRSEFEWAALDCPSGIGGSGGDLEAPGPFVLGRLAVDASGAIRAGEEHVVLGWRIHAEGRKLTAGSAIFTANGDLRGLARATWISLT